MSYETVCGLEIHTELATQTKIFCSCTTAFAGEANTHCCAVCLGMPGALPVLNRRVIEFAVRCGLALHCDISRFTCFDRKNYFYPDLPKAYQISQLYLPICRNGYLEIRDSVKGGIKKVRIHEIHMEEDAGKLMHADGKTLINYNRAGVPLLEIVSEPDLANGTEAAEYAEKLRAVLQFCGISDCRMEQGSLRADVNVSVRKQGSKELGTRTEMKNLSSFKAIRCAVDSEAQRQISLLESGGKVLQQTRRWDEQKNTSFAMRTKEEAHDYRYFPEPDLPPLVLTDDYIDNIRKTLPELPDAKKKRYQTQWGLSDYDAALLCADFDRSILFERTLQLTGLPKATANLIMGEVMRLQKEGEGCITPEALAKIVTAEAEGKITREAAKEVTAAVYYDAVEPLTYIRQHALEITEDLSYAETVTDNVIAANAKAVCEYREGKGKALNFLLGQCMKELKGKVPAALIKEMLIKKLRN